MGPVSESDEGGEFDGVNEEDEVDIVFLLSPLHYVTIEVTFQFLGLSKSVLDVKLETVR